MKAAATGSAGLAAYWWRLPVARSAPEVGPLRDLAMLLAGPVIERGSPLYDGARKVMNRRYDSVRPLAVAYPLGASDVARSIWWSRKHAVPMVVRSGGHGYCGFSTISGGLVLDLSRMAAIASDSRTATIGAGARLGEMYSRLGARDVVVPSGSCLTIGIGGITLGGGHGFYARKHGLTCDNVLAAEIVTADGKRLVCDRTHHQDLFFACRGGGGNYGVVTRWSFAHHPVGDVSTFEIVWPWSQAERALIAWQAFGPAAPDALSSVVSLRSGSRGVSCVGQFLGPRRQLDALLSPLAGVGSPLSVTTRASSNLDAVRRWAGQRGRATFAAKSDYARRPLPREAIRVLIRGIEQRNGMPGRGSVQLDAYGGAINRVPREATAFPHRDALFSFQYLAYWNAPDEQQRNLDWLRRLHRAMRPYVSGEAYLNYCDPDLADPQTAYFGANLRRLRAIRKKYDPRDFFRNPQGV